MKLHVSLKIVMLMSGVMAMLSLSACDGIFDDMYDRPMPEEKNEYGFVYIDDKTHTGRIYIDATEYTEWHYIDLQGKLVTTTVIDGEAPAKWDFAIHRYDTKTNGGKVLESSVNDFDLLPDIKELSKDLFVPDEWTTEQIRIDMSQMMDGVIVYAEDYYNPCLARWLNVNTSTMPPVYTLSGKVYVLMLSDGTYAALRLADYMNDAAMKGFMTIDYLYPIEL